MVDVEPLRTAPAGKKIEPTGGKEHPRKQAQNKSLVRRHDLCKAFGQPEGYTMVTQSKVPEGNESYLADEPRTSEHAFDAELLREPLTVLPMRRPLVFSPAATVTAAMRAMQAEHRGCVVVTEDGTLETRLVGIFTERDVLYRVVDRGHNPAALPLREVMTGDPEGVPRGATIASVLNEMAVGGFRHVPIVDEVGRPVFVVSVRDVVQLLVEFFPAEILTLPPRSQHAGVKSREGA